MVKANNNRACRAHWGVRFERPAAKWLQDIDTTQRSVQRGLSRILRRAGYGCDRCSEARQAAGEDEPSHPNPALRFLGEGSWNRAFLVEPCRDHPAQPPWPLVLRVALPAITRFSKVRGEVATMDWVRDKTSIPVPEVIAYQSHADNATSFEWILMTRARGVPYADIQHKLSLSGKRMLAETLADWVHSLSIHRFDKIGTLVSGPDDRRPYVLGPPVVTELFAGDWRNDYDLPTGPFPDAASLAHALVRCRSLEARDPRQLRRAKCCQADELARLPSVGLDKAAWPDAHAARKAYRLQREVMLAQAAAADERDLANGRLVPKVSHESTRMTVPELKQQAEVACPLMDALVDAVLGEPDNSDSGIDSNGSPVLGGFTLQHWDIHHSNLLLDPETGRPVALLDWEHLFAAPIEAGQRYPWVMMPRANEKEVEVPVEEAVRCNYYLPDRRGGNRNRISLFATHGALMRAAFDARLARLNSPWLASYMPPCVRHEVAQRERFCGRPAPTWPSPAQEVARQVYNYASRARYEVGRVEKLVEEAERAGFVVERELGRGKGVSGSVSGTGEDEDDDFTGMLSRRL